MSVRAILLLAGLMALSARGSADEKAAPPTASAPVSMQTGHIKLASKLSESARALLRTRMRWHAGELGDLVYSLVTLDYGTTGALAQGIAAGPSVARPLTGEARELKSQLPAQFFVLQDRLKKTCLQLAAAARKRNAVAASAALGKVTSTCVRCHALFFKDTANK